VLQAGDHQLQMRDHRLGAGGTGFGFPAGQLLRRQGGAKGVDIGGNRFAHGNDSTTVGSVGTENEYEMFSILTAFSRLLPGARCVVDVSSQSLRACSRAERR
jgi:hypothetical protein